MSYLGDHRRNLNKQKRSRQLTVFLVLVILLAVFASGLSRTLLYTGEAVWSFFQSFDEDLKNTVLPLTNKKVMAKRIQELELKEEEFNLATLNIENLTNQLSDFRTANPNQNLLTASVLVPPKNNIYDRMVISVGRNDGISTGDQVLITPFVAIGVISKALNNVSYVDLYSTSDTVIDGFLIGSNVPVELTGQGLGAYKVKVVRDVDVKMGDYIAIPDSTQSIIAVVQEVIFDPQDPFKELLASLPVNLNSIHVVTVRPR